MSLRNQHPLITKKMFIILKTTHKQLLIIYKRYSYLASHERKRDILIYAAPLLPCPGILPHKIMLFICTKFCAAVFHVSLRITQNMEGSNLFLGPPDSVRHHLRLRGERGRSQRWRRRDVTRYEAGIQDINTQNCRKKVGTCRGQERKGNTVSYKRPKLS